MVGTSLPPWLMATWSPFPTWEAPWMAWAAYTHNCTATNLQDTFSLHQRRCVCVCVCV